MLKLPKGFLAFENDKVFSPIIPIEKARSYMTLALRDRVKYYSYFNK
jgi:hypothetical protein